MSVYIAKHYWKDGEHSTWECHKKIDKQLFKYFKENYHKFVVEKPRMIQQGKQTIYLCYEDKIDSYGRTIVNITFFVLSKKVDYSFCNEVEVKDLELTILEQENNKLWIAIVVVILIGLGIIYKIGLVNGNESIASSYTKTAKEKNILDYTVFIKNWNTQMENNSEPKFKLSENNKTVISELNKMVSDFNITFNENIGVDKLKNKFSKKLETDNNMADIVKAFLKNKRGKNDKK